MSFDKNGRLWAGVESQMLTVLDVPKLDTTSYPAVVSSLNIFDKTLQFKNKELLKTQYNEIDTLWHIQKTTLSWQINLK